MIRPIKFRGRVPNIGVPEDGKIVFGSFDEPTCTIDCWDTAETVVVERDSVSQLVGYDANGNEVYEGDELTDNVGNDWEAIFYGHARDHDCADITRDFEDVFLKEVTK